MDTQKIMRVAMLAAVLSMSWGTANAAVTQADIDVAVRSLNFINGITGSEHKVLVVYNPASSASRADAEAASAALSAARGKFSFTPVLTTLATMGAGGKLAYISDGMENEYAALRSALAESRILSFTHDRDCVAARACALFVSAKPSVEIQMSQSALTATNYEMAAALKMMVKEVP